jgi:conjugative relaxase-like TrwC/TraI family protein
MVATLHRLKASVRSTEYYLGAGHDRDNYYTTPDLDGLRWFGTSDTFVRTGDRVAHGQFRDLLTGYLPDYLYEEGQERWAMTLERNPDVDLPRPNVRGRMADLFRDDPQGKLTDAPSPDMAWRAMRRNSGKEDVGGKDVIGGVDFQLTVDKQVSSFATFIEQAGTEAEKKAMNDALFEAVNETMADITRIGAAVSDIQVDGNRFKKPADEIIAAIAAHSTSREGDPQRHFHCVIANVGLHRNEDGTLSRYAIDPGILERHKFLLAALFQERVGYKLSQIPGFEGIMQEDHETGRVTVGGIPKALIKEWSKRYIQAKAEAAKRGLVWKDLTADERQAIILETRAPKDTDFVGEACFKKWAADAAKHGVDMAERLAYIKTLKPMRRLTDEEIIAEAIEKVSEQTATWESRELGEAVAKACRKQRSGDDIHALLQKALQEMAVKLSTSPSGRTTYATRFQIALEKEIHAIASLAGNRREFIANKDQQVRQAIARFEQESGRKIEEDGEQWKSIFTACSNDSISIIEGSAGAGKSTAAGAFIDVYTGSGYRVLGFAPSWKAAGELKESAGLFEAHAVQKLVHQLKRQAQGRKVRNPIKIDGNTCIVLDEAGMADTETMALLLREADKAGAKVILMGDSKQLAAVQAGAPLAALVRRHRNLTDRINTVWRQSKEWQRHAVEEMSAENSLAAPAMAWRTIGNKSPITLKKGERLSDNRSTAVKIADANKAAALWKAFGVENDGVGALTRNGFKLVEQDKRLFLATASNEFVGRANDILGMRVHEVAAAFGLEKTKTRFEDALHTYREKGCVAFHADGIDAIGSIRDDAIKALRAGRDHIALAVRNDDVVNLNVQLREVRREIGLIHGPDHLVEVVTRAEQAGAGEDDKEKTRMINLAAGENILFGERLKLTSHGGQEITVQRSEIAKIYSISPGPVESEPRLTLDLGIDPKTGEQILATAEWTELIGRRDPDPETGVIPPVVPMLQSAGAMTIASSQGMTIEGSVSILASAGGMDSGNSLVALSRHKDDVRMHINSRSFKTRLYGKETEQAFVNFDNDAVWQAYVDAAVASTGKSNAGDGLDDEAFKAWFRPARDKILAQRRKDKVKADMEAYAAAAEERAAQQRADHEVERARRQAEREKKIIFPAQPQMTERPPRLELTPAYQPSVGKRPSL